MKITRSIALLLTGLLFLGFSGAHAQDATNDSADVWAVVEEVWNAEAKGDRKWLDRRLADDFAGWNKNSPAPRNKLSTKMWDRFGAELGEMVAHELYPLSIIVHDDVAVAHYLYSSAFKTKDGDIETDNGRYTDILVRTDDGWQFLAWHGGDDE